MTPAEIYAVIDPCDPDHLRAVPHLPGFYMALWVGEGFTIDQLFALHKNPRVFLHTGAIKAVNEEITVHTVTFSIKSEGRELDGREGVIIPLTLTRN